jgi:hypothetical protein
MHRRPLLVAAVVWALLAPGSSASAAADDDAREQSRAAFRRGVTDAQQGRYANARDSFLEAYRLFSHPSILLNLGIARAHIGEWLEAEQDLLHFLADDGGALPDELASARAELTEARNHLGTFRLRVGPAGARAHLDSRPIALIPEAFVEVRTTRGAHEVRVEAEGYVTRSRPLVLAGERGPDVDVALAPREAPRAPSAEGPRTAGWLTVAGGVVSLAVGAFCGLEAESLAHGYNTPDSGSYQDPSTKARGLAFRTSADVAFATALALGGVGTYLLVTGPATTTQARLVVTPGLRGIAVTF